MHSHVRQWRRQSSNASFRHGRQPPATSHRPQPKRRRCTGYVCVCVCVRVCLCARVCGGGRGVPEEPLTGTHSTSMWMKLCSNRTPELVKFVPFFQKKSYIRTQYYSIIHRKNSTRTHAESNGQHTPWALDGFPPPRGYAMLQRYKCILMDKAFAMYIVIGLV